MFLFPKEKREYSPEEVKLALYGRAFAHPTRLAILNFLKERHTCISGDIRRGLKLPMTTMSEHMAVLKDAGLLESYFEQPTVIYSINNKAWAEAKKLFEAFLER